MKKIIVACVIGTICALSTANAQIAMSDRDKSTFVSSHDLTTTTDDLNTNSVNPLAVKDFKKRVTTVQNEKWENTPTGFIAYYNKDAVQNRVMYNKRGKWMYTVLGYTRDGLDETLRDAIEYEYGGMITNVSEIETRWKTIYLVHLTTETSYKTIRIDDGEMEIIEQFQKG